jgi:hypothetical protein
VIARAGVVAAGQNPLSMSATKSRPLILIALVALFLYWVVQDPIGAAKMIHDIADWIAGALQLMAERIVQFLSALTN